MRRRKPSFGQAWQNYQNPIRVLNANLKTPPSEEPLTLQEAKDHLLVTSTSQDTYISTLITAARKQLERYTQRAFITQTWVAYGSNWYGKGEYCYNEPILLPYPKLQSVTEIKYFDLQGTEQTLDPTQFYHVDDISEPCRIVRRYNAIYPYLQYGKPNSFSIEYVAGFGAAVDVPEDIKHAMKLLITDFYEHRGQIVIGTVNKIPDFICDLVHSYKIYEF